MKRIQIEAIKNYDKKITWMETQPPSNNPSIWDMERAIGMGWSNLDCPYCLEYIDNDCIDCNLNPRKKILIYPTRICCNGLYKKMVEAKTYRTCIKYAKQVREYIRVNG